MYLFTFGCITVVYISTDLPVYMYLLIGEGKTRLSDTQRVGCQVGDVGEGWRNVGGCFCYSFTFLQI